MPKRRLHKSVVKHFWVSERGEEQENKESKQEKGKGEREEETERREKRGEQEEEGKRGRSKSGQEQKTFRQDRVVPCAEAKNLSKKRHPPRIYCTFAVE